MLANLNNIDAFESYSPFGYMYKFDAKMVFFNVVINMEITFTHYVEEPCKCHIAILSLLRLDILMLMA